MAMVGNGKTAPSRNPLNMRLSKALTTLMIPPKQIENPKRVSQSSPSLAEFATFPAAFRIIRKYRWGALGIFVSIILAVSVAATLAPKTYQSEAKLFVKVGRESVSLDPTATTGQMISVYESRENEINSVVDVLQSRVIIERIVEKIGPRLREEKEPAQIGEQSARLKNDRLIRELERSIEVIHSKKSNVITVTAKAKSPELAQTILKEVLAAFREQHLRINRTQGSFEFFQEQKGQLEQKLNTARTNFRDAKNQYGLVSIEGHRKNLEEQIQSLELAIMENDRERLATKAELNAIEEMKRNTLPELQVQTVTGFFNDAREQTRDQLHQLELEHQKLTTKCTERQSQVRSVKAKIDAARAILATNVPGNAQQTQARNPAYEQIELQRIETGARIESLSAKQTMLAAQKDALLMSLKELNESEIQLACLKQEIDLCEATYKTYSEKFEQARIDQELELDRISNVNIVQPATLLLQPISPKKTVLLSLGFLVALLTAGSYGFLREFMSIQRA
jgi:uncharacterized protein involved in exopolysaccharide biosynthesis